MHVTWCCYSSSHFLCNDIWGCGSRTRSGLFSWSRTCYLKNLAHFLSELPRNSFNACAASYSLASYPIVLRRVPANINMSCALSLQCSLQLLNINFIIIHACVHAHQNQSLKQWYIIFSWTQSTIPLYMTSWVGNHDANDDCERVGRTWCSPLPSSYNLEWHSTSYRVVLAIP